MSKETDIRSALNEKEGFQIWWRLLRPHTLTASFVPVFIGTMLAWMDGQIHIPVFLAMLLASILIQAATNMFNEYYDFKRGLDTEQSVGIGGTIVRDGIQPGIVIRLAFSFYGIALLLGIYICIASSWWIAIIGLICMLFGYLYTGGPVPIAYTPFGELFAGFFMGTVIIGISYFIQTATVTMNVLLISIPIALLIGAILLANNIRDLDGDKKSGRKTIAILIGRNNAIKFLASLFIIAYGLTIMLILIGILPAWALLVLISIKKPYDVIVNFKGKTTPLEMMPAMIATGKTNTVFGLLLSVALLIGNLFTL